MLELLDLRERGERLEATRLETDPTVADTVTGILQRVFVEGDDVLIELAQRFDGCDISETGVLVTEAEFKDAEADTPPDLRAALDALIERLKDLHCASAPRGVGRRTRRRALRRDRPSARERGVLRARRSRRVSVVGVHDRRARGGRRASRRSSSARRRRRTAPSPTPCCTPPCARAPPTSSRPAAPRRSGAMAYGTEIDPTRRPHRGSGQRVRHRGQAAGGRRGRDRRARRSDRAHDRGGRRHRHRHGRPRSDRPGRTRPGGARRSSSPPIPS